MYIIFSLKFQLLDDCPLEYYYPKCCAFLPFVYWLNEMQYICYWYFPHPKHIRFIVRAWHLHFFFVVVLSLGPPVLLFSMPTTEECPSNTTKLVLQFHFCHRTPRSQKSRDMKLLTTKATHTHAHSHTQKHPHTHTHMPFINFTYFMSFNNPCVMNEMNENKNFVHFGRKIRWKILMTL